MSTKPGFFSLSALWQNNLFLFLLIVLAHIGFKVLYLNNSGFWYGEAFYLFHSEQDWGLIKHTAEWNRNAPLYYYFLSIWRNIFGISEITIRISSVIFSSMAAGLLYVLINKHFNRLAAVTALVFFTFSNDIYFYSQETSPHSLVLFLAVASFYLFFNLIDKSNIVTCILLGICNFLMMYAQYVTIIIPVFQMALVLVFFNKQIFKWMGISFLISLLLAVWRITPKTLYWILYPENAGSLTMPTSDNLKAIFYNMFVGEILSWIFLGLSAVTIFYLLFSKRLMYEEKKQNMKFVAVLLGGLGSIFGCYYLYFLMPEFSKDFFLFASPFLFAVPGILVSKLGNEIKYAIAGATIFFSLCLFTKMNLNVKKTMDYRNAVMVVKKLQKPGTLIMVETRDIGFLFAYYYNLNAFKDFKEMESKLKEQGVYLVSTAEDAKAIDLNNYKRVVLTQTFETLNKSNLELVEYLYSQYKFNVSTRRYNEVGLTLFARK